MLFRSESVRSDMRALGVICCAPFFLWFLFVGWLVVVKGEGMFKNTYANVVHRKEEFVELSSTPFGGTSKIVQKLLTAAKRFDLTSSVCRFWIWCFFPHFKNTNGTSKVVHCWTLFWSSTLLQEIGHHGDSAVILTVVIFLCSLSFVCVFVVHRRSLVLSALRRFVRSSPAAPPQPVDPRFPLRGVR